MRRGILDPSAGRDRFNRASRNTLARLMDRVKLAQAHGLTADPGDVAELRVVVDLRMKAGLPVSGVARSIVGYPLSKTETKAIKRRASR